MSFGTRLKERRESLGITQPQLAGMLNVSKGAIGNWETDVNSPRATILYDLFEILHCDANYLFQDETRELYKNEASPEEFENIVKKYRSLDDSGRERIDFELKKECERIQQIEELKKQLAADFSEEISQTCIYPYLGKIACAGTGFYFDDIPTDTIEAIYVKGADFIIGVSGESMEPDYHDGEKLYVRKVEYLRHGDIGIFTIGNECFLKELGEDGLISRNKDYNDIPGDEKVRLVGKVIGKVEKD